MFLNYFRSWGPDGSCVRSLQQTGFSRLPLHFPLPKMIYYRQLPVDFTFRIARHICMNQCSGKKSKSVFDFLTYSRETWFSFSYVKVEELNRANEPSNEIDRVSKFDNSLSFGAKKNALLQIFFALRFFKDFFTKNFNWILNFLWFCVGSINECIYDCLSMQIQENMFMSTAAHLWGCFGGF